MEIPKSPRERWERCFSPQRRAGAQHNSPNLTQLQHEGPDARQPAPCPAPPAHRSLRPAPTQPSRRAPLSEPHGFHASANAVLGPCLLVFQPLHPSVPPSPRLVPASQHHFSNEGGLPHASHTPTKPFTRQPCSKQTASVKSSRERTRRTSTCNRQEKPPDAPILWSPPPLEQTQQRDCPQQD